MQRMSRLGEVSISELQHLFDSLQEQEQITAAEHQALLELAEQLSQNKPSPR